MTPPLPPLEGEGDPLPDIEGISGRAYDLTPALSFKERETLNQNKNIYIVDITAVQRIQYSEFDMTLPEKMIRFQLIYTHVFFLPSDLYYHEARLVIEVDGPVHARPDRKQHEEQRDGVMEDFGIMILRFL